MTNEFWKRFVGSELAHWKSQEEGAPLGTIYNHDRAVSHVRASYRLACTEYQRVLAKKGRSGESHEKFQNPLHVFTRLDLRRDAFGRAMGIRWADIAGKSSYKKAVVEGLAYIRPLFLKRMLLLRVANAGAKAEMLDWRCEIVRAVFDVRSAANAAAATVKKSSGDENEPAAREDERKDSDEEDAELGLDKGRSQAGEVGIAPVTAAVQESIGISLFSRR